MKPSTLCDIRRDIAQLVMFERWDHTTKQVLNNYMNARNIQYRAAEYLTVKNNLKIWIIEDNREYLIVI